MERAKGTQNILRLSLCNNHEAVDIEMGLNLNAAGNITVTKKAIKLDLFEGMTKIVMFDLIIHKKRNKPFLQQPRKHKKLRHIFMRWLQLETISFVPYAD